MIKEVRFASETIRSPFYQWLRESCNPLDQRFVITFLLALGILCNYMQRICFYITLVEMTKRVSVDDTDFYSKHEGSWERCPHIFIEEKEEGEFRDWSDATQGYLLASFFFGHFLTSVFGGFIADKYGAKEIFGASIILSSVCSFFTPIAALTSGPYAVMFVRFLMGIVQGPMFPAGAALLSKWSPSHERPLHSAVANSGVPMGSFLANLLAGNILSSCSWQWVFYIYAFIGIAIYALWEVLVFSSPASHKYISSGERTFIETSIQFTSPATHGRIPWKQIFLSRKFRVIVWANFGFDWGFYIVSLELPFYLYHVLHLPIMKIGEVASMPWLCMWLGAVIFGMVSQFLISEGIIRKIDMRKSMAIISTLVPAVLLILASWATCSHVLVCLLFSLSMFYAGAVYSGLRLSVMDLAPNFSGLLMSLVNAFGSLSGAAVPLIVHSMIDEGGTIMQWRMSFWLATVFMFISSVPYLLFATCAIQDWNKGIDREGPEKSSSRPTGSQEVDMSASRLTASQEVDTSTSRRTGSQEVDKSTSRRTGSQEVDKSRSRRTGSQKVNTSRSRRTGSQEVNTSTSRRTGSQEVNTSTSRRTGSQEVNTSTSRRTGSQEVDTSTSRTTVSQAPEQEEKPEGS